MFRFGCVCRRASLYAPQAQNNVVRVAYEAMASVLGGVQSMFTAAWDEPFALPSEESATLALRTQQILAYETGVTRVADPLGGSYFVEALTDATEERIVEIMDDLEQHGGMVAVYRGRLSAGPDRRRGLSRASGRRDRGAAGRRGQRSPRRAAAGDRAPTNWTPRAGDLQLKRLAEVKADRDSTPRSAAPWPRSSRPPRDDENLMHRLIDCANAYCTVGEMVAALKAVWGEFQQPVVF